MKIKLKTKRGSSENALGFERTFGIYHLSQIYTIGIFYCIGGNFADSDCLVDNTTNQDSFSNNY